MPLEALDDCDIVNNRWLPSDQSRAFLRNALTTSGLIPVNRRKRTLYPYCGQTIAHV